MVKEIQEALDENKHVMGLFLDLSKAFDSVNHQKLLTILQECGIQGKDLSWFISYVIGRKQFVQVKEAISGVIDVSCGVPQGSILGPILFIVYINDIMNLQLRGKQIVYADDTNLLYVSDTEEGNISSILNDLACLEDWLTNKHLTLNLKKTVIVNFQSDRKISSCPKLIFKSHELISADSVSWSAS